jgi:hypothetical protein
MEAATLSLVRDNQPSSCSESPPVRTCYPEGTSTVSAPVETLKVFRVVSPGLGYPLKEAPVL